MSSFFPSSTTLPPAAKRPPANKTSKSVSPYREKSSAVASRTCAHCTTSASLRMHAGAAKLQLAYAARAMMTVAWAFCMSISMQFAACNCRHCMTLACMNVSAARITAGCCFTRSGRGHYLHASKEIGLEVIPVLLVLEDGNDSVCEGSWVEGNSDVPLASLDLHAAATLTKSQRSATRKSRSPPARCQEAPQKLQGSCHRQQGVAAYISCHSQGRSPKGSW